MGVNAKALLLIVLTCFSHANLLGKTPIPIQLDGQFDDWARPDVVATDPESDATGAFDLTRVAVVTNGHTLYTRFDTQQPLNLQSGPVSDGTLALRIELPQGRQLLVDFRARQATLSTTGGSTTIPWSDLQFAALPTYATTDFELRIDLGAIGVRAGEQVRLNFEGSDELEEPIALTLDKMVSIVGNLQDPKSRALGSIRVASLNTLKQGSASDDRAASIGKLFEFAEADVYCFNEALDESVFRASCFNVLPESFSNAKDNVHWSATCGIVSRYPLEPLPFQSREAAALIEIPDGQNLVVVSAHFKCCGFEGSREDQTRVDEVNELLTDLERMRRGEFGQKAAIAGVIVLGDFNLVGSRKPLDLLNAAGLKDVLLTCPTDGSAMTWRGISPTESFWPGRLDYCTIDQDRLQSLGGYILNTEQLNELNADDVADIVASDHSMMVIDVAAR